MYDEEIRETTASADFTVRDAGQSGAELQSEVQALHERTAALHASVEGAYGELLRFHPIDSTVAREAEREQHDVELAVVRAENVEIDRWLHQVEEALTRVLEAQERACEARDAAARALHEAEQAVQVAQGH